MTKLPNNSLAKRYCLPNPKATLTDEIILQQIPANSRVIDLGCGDGRLLHTLRDKNHCSILGVEVDQSEILRAMQRGVPVIQSDLDRGLAEVPNDSFDFAVLSQTLQQVRLPKDVLNEMLRIARKALIVVPNFGHWRVRLQIIRYGRAPVTDALPYEWYDSPNLHFMTMHDFRELVAAIGFRIVQELPIVKGRAKAHAWAANLRADSALYLLERPAQ
jgi:methionine biosynthesis protein MetW